MKWLVALAFALLLTNPALATDNSTLNTDTLRSALLPDPLKPLAVFERTIAIARSVNMQATGSDFQFTMYAVPGNWRATRAFLQNCNATAAGAVGSINTAISGGGTAIVSAQAYTGTDQVLTISFTANTTATQLWSRIATPATNPAVCDIVVVALGTYP